MSHFIRLAVVFMASLLLAGCYTSATHSANSSTAAYVPAKINCKALERQQLYNQTNMNTETGDTTTAQRQALDQLITKNCKNK